MRFDHATWKEIEDYLATSHGIIIPTGSTEQHGPIGLTGTDALCAEIIAENAAREIDALVAPVLAYTPAPFNSAFPGTISISEPLFESTVYEILQGLFSQGFERAYFLNGHGANLAPLTRVAERFNSEQIRIRNWWDFESVNDLRTKFYGDWEGMHGTPSEISITQAVHRVVTHQSAIKPPRKLSSDYVEEHSGDRHGPPEQHRAQFPDGRVGSHSALASPEHGRLIIEAATTAVACDYQNFVTIPEIR